MRVQSMGHKDPLEEGMATHSTILAWRIPWTEEPGGLQSVGSQTVGLGLATEPEQEPDLLRGQGGGGTCRGRQSDSLLKEVLPATRPWLKADYASYLTRDLA